MAMKINANKKAGVSLLELLISVGIFSIIVLPLMVVPLKAFDKTTQNKDESMLNFELTDFFGKFQKEVNLSYRFMDVSQIKLGNLLDDSTDDLNLVPDKQIFMAYWDESSKTEKRVAYQIRELYETPATAVSADPVSYSPKRWQLLRTEVPDPGEMYRHGSGEFIPQDSLVTNQVWFPMKDSTPPGENPTKWKRVGKILGNSNKNEFYLTTENSADDPYFIYCRASICNNTIKAAEADGVRIQSADASADGATASGFNMVYKNSQISLKPAYFKLASMQSVPDRSVASEQIMPFATAVNRWGIDSTWIGEITKKITVLGAGSCYRVPYEKRVDVTTIVNTGAAGCTYNPSTMKLEIKDMHYNYRTGELLSVSNSPAGDTANERGLYIFKSSPGVPDYKPYVLSMFKQSTYSDTFPVVVHYGDPAWPAEGNPAWPAGKNPFTLPEFLSVTQDLEDNIYVLVRTKLEGGAFDNYANGYQFWVEKFSPQGAYISRFNLGTDNDGGNGTSSLAKSAVRGITYNPSAPGEIMVLMVKNLDNNLDGHKDVVIRAYPKDQNNDDPTQVVVSAESPILNTTSDIVPALKTYGDQAFPINSSFGSIWHTASMDYDPFHNRFLFVFSPVHKFAGGINPWGCVPTNTPLPSEILALDIDLQKTPPVNYNDGTPASRAVFISHIYPTDSVTMPYKMVKDTCWGGYKWWGINQATGIAYDPLSNNLFISTKGGPTSDPYAIYRVVPNARMNVVHQ